MTALIDTLFQIEKQLGLELDSLLPYAEKDNIGGFHPDPAQRQWDVGAIFDVEGRTLYAVIRALQPRVIVEIGSGTGCSAAHMAAALVQNYVNPATAGHIITVDRGNTPHIPDDFKSFVTAIPDDAINYLALQPDNSIDFLLEDADHTTELCHAIGELAKTKLKPGGVLFVHDIEHWAVGADIRRGYDLAGMEVRRYRSDPSDCGWGVWQRPGEMMQYSIGRDPETGKPVHLVSDGKVYQDAPKTDDSPVIDTTVLQAQEDYPDVVSEAPADTWTPATLSKGQEEMLNLDAKWQAEDKAKPAPVKRTRKPKAKS